MMNDEFRLIEPTGDIVGRRSWVAESDPELTDDNIWGIHVIGEKDD